MEVVYNLRVLGHFVHWCFFGVGDILGPKIRQEKLTKFTTTFNYIKSSYITFHAKMSQYS